MARHGSALAEHPTPADPSEATRRGRAAGGVAGWPIRRKLAALVALPTALMIGLVGFLVSQSYGTWKQASRAQIDADMMISANALTTVADTELQQTLASRLKSAKATQDLPARRKATDAALAALISKIAVAPDGGWSPLVARRATEVRNIQQNLPQLRTIADSNGLQLATVAQGFDVNFQPVRDLTTVVSAELRTHTPNPRAVDGAAVLAAVSGTASRSSQELVLLTTALQENRANTAKVNEIAQAAAGQDALLDLAYSRADDTQRSRINAVRAQDAAIASARTIGINIAREGSGSAQSDRDALAFSSVAGKRLDMLNNLVASSATDLQQQTTDDQGAALWRLLFLGGLALASMILISLLVSSLARTITVPMRRLRSGAVDAATVRLPAAVRQIEREGPEAVVAVPPVLPIEAKVGPETREVAQALDGLTGEAIRLATSQVRLRQSLDEAFVSMSRRSQSMVEKQLAIIDELESTEEDPEQLRNLFRLDHLAARMRRYNDNLLVLAGSAVRTRSSAPVAIADVFRAATSEMEQYERVRLQPLSGASVAGASAGGLIHLVAELLDNAAMYSPPTSPIVLAAAYTHEGGLRLEVTDSGVGIPPAELADLNARLAMPGTIDSQVPSRMGLYVVARLAQRGGFGVRLAARAQAAGTVAEVTVPKAQVLGAPTGPLDTVPAAPAIPVGEAPRLPAQHGGTATPMGGVTRPSARTKSPRSRPSGPPVAPAAPTHSATPAVAGTAPGAVAGAAAGSGAPALPSRRPGAALAGNPLAGRMPEPPTGRNTPGGAPGDSATEAASPFLSPPPWTERSGQPSRNGAPAPATDTELPRREPGTSGRARTPFTTPAPFSAPGTTPGSPGPFEPPLARRTEGHEMPTAVPGRRPGARPLPVRAPGQPGGGPAIGPSAATAIAAAASARSRPPTSAPKSGLFSAATATPAESTLPAAADATAQAPVPDAAAKAPTAPPALPTRPKPAATTPAAPAAPTVAAPLPAAAPAAPAPADSEGAPSPFELEARAAAAASTGRYQPADPNAPMIGTVSGQPERAQTPIFDSISVWFSDDRAASVAGRPAEPAQVIDLRESAGLRPTGTAPAPAPSAPAGGMAPFGVPAASGPGTGNRWASLGDQRWIATNMRAAAAPETAGATSAGLPRRRPGANLLPSAAAAAGAPTAAPTPPARRTDAESVRGRLGSYQRGLSSARRARHLPPEPDSSGMFHGGTEAGQGAGRQGGDQ